jgi:hypothetical protein
MTDRHTNTSPSDYPAARSRAFKSPAEKLGFMAKTLVKLFAIDVSPLQARALMVGYFMIFSSARPVMRGPLTMLLALKSHGNGILGVGRTNSPNTAIFC